MYNKILVPLDGSKLAEIALPHAGAIARGLGSEVVLVSVSQPISKGLLVTKDRIEDAGMLEGYALVPPDWGQRHALPQRPEHTQQQEEQWEEYLATVEQRMADAWRDYHMAAAQGLAKDGVKLSSVLLFGLAVDQIIDYANKNGVDLIVMSGHGRGGGGRWFAGSVAERVLREAGIPVLLVRAKPA